MYARYAADVFTATKRKLCNSRLAEDVVQHIFTALWDHPERFDPERGSLRAYLLMLASCHSIDLIRSETARRQRETIDVAILLDEPEGTVKSRIRLGLNRLRSAMADE